MQLTGNELIVFFKKKCYLKYGLIYGQATYITCSGGHFSKGNRDVVITGEVLGTLLCTVHTVCYIILQFFILRYFMYDKCILCRSTLFALLVHSVSITFLTVYSTSRLNEKDGL